MPNSLLRLRVSRMGTRQQSLETFRSRTQIDIVTLELRLKEEVAKHGSIRDFHVMLWRCNPDATGCNWNARIERVRGRNSSDAKSWWDVVPQMRVRFNLK
jgi:hypothetical protein